MAFHQHAGAAAHDGLGDGPLAVDEPGLRAHAQRPGRVAEAHGLAFAATGGAVHQRARDRRRRADGDRGGSHHRVVQLAHRQRAHVQVEVAGGDALAAGRHVILRG